MEIVINNCYGGFGLSEAARDILEEVLDVPLDTVLGEDSFRAHPALIEVIKGLGEGVNDCFSELKIVEIPDDVEWQIEEYDGSEWIAEKHRTWGSSY